MNTHKLTLGQASKEVGCSKATLSKALNNGSLSGEKHDDGSWQIDPSELMRWNANRSTRNTKNASQTPERTPENGSRTLELMSEVAELRAKLSVIEEAGDRERRQLEDQVSDLRERLDRSEEERRGLSERLLAAPEKPADGPKRSWWSWGRQTA